MGELTVQSILHRHLVIAREQRGFALHQHKALSKLSVCRTAALGGHTQYCEKGHVNGVWYNSCRHRACHQCQGLASERWLHKTEELLLDCTHHHVVFTLPSETHDWWRYNREKMSDLLFKTVLDTLKVFCRDSKLLGAQPGILMALHTWGRSLNLHPHIHVLISHGGLDYSNEWIEPKKKILFPRNPVMRKFRGMFLSRLKQAMREPEWCHLPDESSWDKAQKFNAMYGKEWVVNFAEPYKHGKGVARYLSSYVKRSPFKNSQLVYAGDDRIVFQYQSHQTKQRERMSLSPVDFISRLMEHAPLFGKSLVRYCGLYTASNRQKLDKAKEAIGQKVTKIIEPVSWQEFLQALGKVQRCEVCGSTLIHGQVISKKR